MCAGLRPQARFGAQPPQSGGTWRGDNPRRDAPSRHYDLRPLCRKSCRFLETASLLLPLAALRLFPCVIEILSFQNFYEVLKTGSAGRKDFFDTLRNAPAFAGAFPFRKKVRRDSGFGLADAAPSSAEDQRQNGEDAVAVLAQRIEPVADGLLDP